MFLQEFSSLMLTRILFVIVVAYLLGIFCDWMVRIEAKSAKIVHLQSDTHQAVKMSEHFASTPSATDSDASIKSSIPYLTSQLPSNPALQITTIVGTLSNGSTVVNTKEQKSDAPNTAVLSDPSSTLMFDLRHLICIFTSSLFDLFDPFLSLT
jgi:hypothetical protein